MEFTATYPTNSDAKRIFNKVYNSMNCWFTDANTGEKRCQNEAISFVLGNNTITAQTNYYSNHSVREILAFDRFIVLLISGVYSQCPAPGSVSIYSTHRSYDKAERVMSRKLNDTDESIMSFDLAVYEPFNNQWVSAFKSDFECDDDGDQAESQHIYAI